MENYVFKFKKNMYFITIIVIYTSLLLGYPMFLAINIETFNIFTTGFLKYFMPIIEIILLDIFLILLMWLMNKTYLYVFDDKIIIKGKNKIKKEYKYSDISIMRYGNIFDVILMKDDCWGLKLESCAGDVNFIISKKNARIIINKFHDSKKS